MNLTVKQLAKQLDIFIAHGYGNLPVKIAMPDNKDASKDNEKPVECVIGHPNKQLIIA